MNDVSSNFFHPAIFIKLAVLPKFFALGQLQKLPELWEVTLNDSIALFAADAVMRIIHKVRDVSERSIRWQLGRIKPNQTLGLRVYISDGFHRKTHQGVLLTYYQKYANIWPMRKLLGPAGAASAALLAACTPAPPEANFVDAVVKNIGSYALDALERCPEDISVSSDNNTNTRYILRANLNCGDIGLEAEDWLASGSERRSLHYQMQRKSSDGTWGSMELVNMYFGTDRNRLERVFAQSNDLGNTLDCRGASGGHMRCQWFGRAGAPMSTTQIPAEIFDLVQLRMDALVDDMLKAAQR